MVRTRRCPLPLSVRCISGEEEWHAQDGGIRRYDSRRAHLVLLQWFHTLDSLAVLLDLRVRAYWIFVSLKIAAHTRFRRPYIQLSATTRRLAGTNRERLRAALPVTQFRVRRRDSQSPNKTHARCGPRARELRPGDLPHPEHMGREWRRSPWWISAAGISVQAGPGGSGFGELS